MSYGTIYGAGARRVDFQEVVKGLTRYCGEEIARRAKIDLVNSVVKLDNRRIAKMAWAEEENMVVFEFFGPEARRWTRIQQKYRMKLIEERLASGEAKLRRAPRAVKQDRIDITAPVESERVRNRRRG